MTTTGSMATVAQTNAKSKQATPVLASPRSAPSPDPVEILS